MDNEQVSFYLSQFIGKNLRIHTSDDRVFGDQMKCTNKDRNIILALTYEYRAQPAEVIRKAVEASGNPSAGPLEQPLRGFGSGSGSSCEEV